MARSVKIFWKIFLIGFLVVILFITLISVGLFGEMPSLAQLENPSITLATEVYGDDGTMLGNITRKKATAASFSIKTFPNTWWMRW